MKLVDDLSPSQFESLVKVLSLPSSEKNFSFLLTPANLQVVFDQPEEFFVPTVLRFNFEGLGSARAREHVLHRLIARDEEVYDALKTEAMAIGDDFPILPPPRCEPQGPRKRPRESGDGSGDRPRVPPVQRIDPGNKLRGAPQALIIPNEASLRSTTFAPTGLLGSEEQQPYPLPPTTRVGLPLLRAE